MTVEEYLVKRILDLESILAQLEEINTNLRTENENYRARLSKLEFIEEMGRENK